MRLYAYLFFALAFLVGCGNNSATASKQPTATPSPDAGASGDGGGQPAIAAGCNPLVGDDCLTPFPSSFYEQSDSTTATGVRVHIGAGLLPTQANETADLAGPTEPEGRVLSRDAVRRVLRERHRREQLSADGRSERLAHAERAGAGHRLRDRPAGDRLRRARRERLGGTRQALIVHPLQRLTPGHRYAIALVGLNDASGAPLAPAPFRALRDGTPLPESLQPLRLPMRRSSPSSRARGSIGARCHSPGTSSSPPMRRRPRTSPVCATRRSRWSTPDRSATRSSTQGRRQPTRTSSRR